MSSLAKDTARLAWFDTGLSPEEIDAVFLKKTAPLSAAKRSVNNMEQFYIAWRDHFKAYVVALKAAGIDYAGVKAMTEVPQILGFTLVIDANKKKIEDAAKGIVPKDMNAENVASAILVDLALKRGQTIPIWFYKTFCEIYSAIEQKISGKGMFKQKYDTICKMADESSIADDMFPKLTSASMRPGPINLPACEEKVRAALTSAQLSELPKISRPWSRFKPRVNAQGLLAGVGVTNFAGGYMQHWRALLVVASIIIAMIIIVVIAAHFWPAKPKATKNTKSTIA